LEVDELADETTSTVAVCNTPGSIPLTISKEAAVACGVVIQHAVEVSPLDRT
jgi:hypothetical protein